MNKVIVVTKEDQKQWRSKMYDRSADAVNANPEAFKKLEAALLKAMPPLDVDDWASTANRIASACRELVLERTGTIFYRPMKDIDPTIYGSASTFRREVTELSDRVEKLRLWMEGV